ncbi:MAG: hypothetical protein AMXMBFR47_08320 [Planctomycetota bacterium]
MIIRYAENQISTRLTGHGLSERSPCGLEDPTRRLSRYPNGPERAPGKPEWGGAELCGRAVARRGGMAGLRGATAPERRRVDAAGERGCRARARAGVLGLLASEGREPVWRHGPLADQNAASGEAVRHG